MNSRTIEIAVGVFVALGLAAFFMLAMKVSNLISYESETGYQISARFDNIGGLRERSPVAVAGVRIGKVSSIVYDNETYEAVVVMEIEPQYNRFPIDTSAGILTAGLLGEQYVGLEPGAEEEFLKTNSVITVTQSAIVLEEVIGQFLYSKADEKE
ncbi:MAG: outer membrane lipid asymmetry maintenance protein MlaD [Gammaproteobacteria bacterium]|nr:outer membrane lipid asymmetry maintenance protein MlaD [Gammaproteobacteria bacterium]